MTPVFKEYLSFLKTRVDIKFLDEGYFWVDNQIIKGFDKMMTVKKIARLKVSDDNDLVELKWYSSVFSLADFCSWSEQYRFFKNTILSEER